MGLSHSPSLVMNGLVLCLDAGNIKSYNVGIASTAWTDLSGRGNNGTLVNGAEYSTINGGAISFNTSGDRININSGLPTGNNWSLNIWFLLSGPTSFTSPLYCTFVSTSNFRFQYNGGNGPFIEFTGAIGDGLATYTSGLVPEMIFNKWKMATVTSDGSEVKVYLNTDLGEVTFFGSRDFSTNGGATVAYDNRSGIGALDPLNGDGGTPYVSLLHVYNRALTASEIQQNFNALRGRFNI